MKSRAKLDSTSYTRFPILLAIITVILLSIPGCNNSPDENSVQPSSADNLEASLDTTSTTPQQKTYTPPSQPIVVELSFPDGAPPLNETGELRGTIKTPWMITETGISVTIQLPDAFELVSGELSWSGTIPKKSSIDAVSAVIKSKKVGNWTIDETHHITEPKTFVGTGYGHLYVAVSENSAEWGIFPPWVGPPATVRPTQSSP